MSSGIQVPRPPSTTNFSVTCTTPEIQTQLLGLAVYRIFIICKWSLVLMKVSVRRGGQDPAESVKLIGWFIALLDNVVLVK
jgi:hypothetical protein